MEQRYAAVRAAFGPDAHICYAVKSNSNLSLLSMFAELGSGFDLVSGGELLRLSQAGLSAAGAVFAGVGKEEWEVRAAHEAGILFFNLESEFELELFEAVGSAESPVPLAVRLNPDIDPNTHEYISTGRAGDKFGLDLRRAHAAIDRIAASPKLQLVGCHVHLGSQLRDAGPYLQAWAKVEEFLDSQGGRVDGMRYYDLGGGFAVSYGAAGVQLDVAQLASALLPKLAARGLTPVLEPGRFLVADAGVLVTRVLGTKEPFAIVDAAMNDLLRPALYGAEHPVVPVQPRDGAPRLVDIVGPVCESGDFLARGRSLPPLLRGDLLAVCSAGAYGSAMASNYNSRRRPAEVMVEGDRAVLIRRRETFEDLWGAEVDL